MIGNKICRSVKTAFRLFLNILIGKYLCRIFGTLRTSQQRNVLRKIYFVLFLHPIVLVAICRFKPGFIFKAALNEGPPPQTFLIYMFVSISIFLQLLGRRDEKNVPNSNLS